MDTRALLLGTLEELTQNQFHTFVFYLDSIPRGRRENATPVRLAELLMRYYPERVFEVTAEVLEKIPRMDLLRVLRREIERAGGISVGNGGDTLGEEASAVAAAAAAAAAPPPPPPPVQPRVVSDQELMKLSKNMGKKWREIGIGFLGVKSSFLEQIEEDNPNNMAMRAFYMLKDWRNREKGGATAARLYDILDQEEVQLDSDAYAFLIENA